MRRKIDNYLKEWRKQSNHKPLIIGGARQVGKTYSVREFGKTYASFVEINFVTHPEYKMVFQDGFEVKSILNNISFRSPSTQFIEGDTLIFFDEFDAMVPQRTNDDRNYQNGETNEFLCMLNNAAEKGIYVLAATNHPERIDKAVLRTGRIDEIIYVDMPDSKARESLFKLELSKLPSAEDIDYGRLADLTNGYNCSDISYIVKMASRKMFNASIKEKDKPYKVITQTLLEESISRKSPSVSSRELREFERVRSEFSPKDEGCRQTTIGFHI